MEIGVVATYENVQRWVREHYGWTPETCWIAHCKELAGLPVRRAPNRRGDVRVRPCPVKGRPAIFAALRHFST
ncbi:MAG: hypothetical protein F4160_13575 [Rhodospirillaceae bacterium]|nr:hypothetical protein [Rhodospirillaceae bacterium]